MLKRFLNSLVLRFSANNDVIVRDAEKHDTRFVVRLLEHEAKASHFIEWPSRSDKAMFTRLVRRVLIPQHRWPLVLNMYDQSQNVFVYTRLFIGEARGQRVGFIAIREVKPGSFEKECEIWMVAVDPERQGLRAGKAMVDLVLETLSEQIPKATIIARCLPASEVMFEMLKRGGFRLRGATPDGNRTLERKPPKKRGSVRR